ncbi:crotonase/enoyl-CoA hydratase family protein [Stutzerimonas kunmingensis]|mgnify:CR=1 FL=1|jgi:enoyl-CoA hydratase/carnithine racemase|uniref:Crotonase/enoyl-CoA hydratase family protein n=1 Tax=Stutzerimonas kunmingensis TaxID=1211807 RepID=A0A9X1N020_9GAMM|nr:MULTISPECIES: crotonase/enoyl-CoA hydratase family protein [Pseudomonadaceae]MBA1277914.1 crotonase/enoyl-CoA hydratase family protein [Stutzerimonas stutzeri]MCD1606411.1 crotonase/enoyl-CoA hydratase family protein [Stutzerimonas kunmingensis]MCW3148745.1 crotonase/enoyl-CoA hydratase family protein [Stutzerimonas sp. S1]PNG01272.1 enoyl-CoA hydratase [Stutzerimonas kunmingensis]TCD23755.1 crotonase/enoyl-CoA hydratase family protein [Pseudomonas sp. IC_126]
MSTFLQIERDGGIVTVRMNHPETRNALTSPEQIQEFVDLCAQLRSDRTARVMVLTGNGSAFCAGGNVKDMRDRAGIFAGSPYELRNTYRDGIQRIPLALYELDIPIIAAVNGPAIGAGLDLACMCDIRLAASSALFAESFVRLGIVPGDGGAWLLPRIIGIPKASLMAFTGDTINAAKALEWGLVEQVCTHETLQAEAQALAQQIAANPGHALRLCKRLLREGQHMRLDSLLELSAAYQSLAHHTEDHQEAVAAFVEKRNPDYLDR